MCVCVCVCVWGCVCVCILVYYMYWYVISFLNFVVCRCKYILLHQQLSNYLSKKGGVGNIK